MADSKDGGKLLKIQDKYKVTSASGGMAPIKEDRLEVASRSSSNSQNIDDIITKGRDPRRNKFEPSGLSKIEEESRKPPSSLTQDDLRKFKQNQEFFRQNEAIIHQIPLEERFKFDKSLDVYFQNFCKQLIKEVTGGPVKRDITSFIDHYGKDYKGFITYSEFKEVYMIHVAPSEA